MRRVIEEEENALRGFTFEEADGRKPDTASYPRKQAGTACGDKTLREVNKGLFREVPSRIQRVSGRTKSARGSGRRFNFHISLFHPVMKLSLADLYTKEKFNFFTST